MRWPGEVFEDTVVRSFRVQAGKQTTLGVSKRGNVLII